MDLLSEMVFYVQHLNLNNTDLLFFVVKWDAGFMAPMQSSEDRVQTCGNLRGGMERLRMTYSILSLSPCVKRK